MSEYITLEKARDNMEAGGPGLDGYAYQAAIYCEDCARDILESMGDDFPMPAHDFEDSENAPAPVFFGESDTAQHCENCGTYLYGEDTDETGADDPPDNVQGPFLGRFPEDTESRPYYNRRPWETSDNDRA